MKLGSLRTCLTIAWVTVAPWAHAQLGTSDGEWRTYGGDHRSLRYSALDQIDAGNFNRLEQVWS